MNFISAAFGNNFSKFKIQIGWLTAVCKPALVLKKTGKKFSVVPNVLRLRHLVKVWKPWLRLHNLQKNYFSELSARHVKAWHRHIYYIRKQSPRLYKIKFTQYRQYKAKYANFFNKLRGVGYKFQLLTYFFRIMGFVFEKKSNRVASRLVKLRRLKYKRRRIFLRIWSFPYFKREMRFVNRELDRAYDEQYSWEQIRPFERRKKIRRDKEIAHKRRWELNRLNRRKKYKRRMPKMRRGQRYLLRRAHFKERRCMHLIFPQGYNIKPK